MSFRENFEELLNIVRETRPEYIEELGKGFSKEEIEAAIDFLPIPDEIMQVYSCICGNYVDTRTWCGLIPFYDVLPLESVKAVYEGLCDRQSLYDMIPFMHDGAGYYICVKESSGDKSVWVIRKGEEDNKTNTSLEKFILTAIESYKCGAYYWDDGYEDEGYNAWDTDTGLWQEVVARIDPEMEIVGLYPP
jgi:SMI1 / KNR4 family (SUKH-1)